ncbi:hypothetical protein ED733_003298 [Metarhizium rileyi]|uniref:Uncharacterized protein n=1 Tax=Metarhizium rileyi (strain RCEF 4871) TaxID=1649241 RepID=A0A5C6G6K3_METRR|nr:hypothetical protein ED733_003298 [Metarhizium rileyi]
MLLRHVMANSDDIYGILSSHPFACAAAAATFGSTAIEHVSLDFIGEHSRAIMEKSPIQYVKEAVVRGTLFNQEDSSGLISGVDTGFFVDHEEPLQALQQVRDNHSWPLGTLPDGHEYLLIVCAKKRGQASSYGGRTGEYTQEYGQAYPQPAYAQADYTQPTYNQPTYGENANLNNYDQGYAGRQGLAPSAAATSIRHDPWGFVKSKWSAAFMGVTTLQAIVCLAFESYVFAKFQTSLGPNVSEDKVQSQYKTIPTFLTLFIFGFLYELVIVWDALRMKNTIQVIGVCIANLALLVYTALQVDQIKMAITVLGGYSALEVDVTSAHLWSKVQALLSAIPAIIALATCCMAFIAWKLYQEFAWDILKNIGADYRMKKRFLHYQIYIALLKFDFFFFLGFIIQFVVVVAQKSDPEFALTIATIPVTIVILLAAAYFTRRENKPGMICVMILFLGGLSYFVFKLVRIYQPSHKDSYFAVRKSLTAFAVITILLIILTIANAIICMSNFNKGLKAHLLASRRMEEKPDATSISLHDVKPQLPSRMTID